MNVLPIDSNEFCLNYINKNFGKNLKNDASLHLFVKNLDSDSFKRMMSAYRADKKRRKDKIAGNNKVRIDIDNSAYQALINYANELNTGVTLSQSLLIAFREIADLRSALVERN